ncbi:MAG: hypothetical protein R3250_05160, partial [Melioribacteraceae bacterium]|nr:hypothetical protein [Melioribacteraceae bacterium]
MKKIRINIPENNYNVYLGNEIAESFVALLNKEKMAGDIFIVIDSNVQKLYPNLLSSYFNINTFKPKYITLQASEKKKSFEAIQRIHSSLIRNKYGRDSIVL